MRAKELLNEVEEKDIGFYKPENDKLGKLSLSHPRKPVITLRHLNRLKMLRATKKVEQLRKEELLSVMYGQKPESEEGGF